MCKYFKCVVASLLLVFQSGLAADKQEIAKKLANPLSSIISIPIQPNYQPNLGIDDEGSKWVTNIQPVVPFTINDEWTLLTRTIIPVISYDTGISEIGTLDGVGDVLFTAWATPSAKTDSGWLLGTGAAFLIPTDSDVSSKKWAAGPSVIAVHKGEQTTYGMLFNHLWSYAGSDAVTDEISTTLMQPFASYVTDNATTFSINTESTYDWVAQEWTVPITAMVSKLIYVGKLPVSLGVGTTYWAKAPENGPEGWGFKMAMTFVLPKKMFGLK